MAQSSRQHCLPDRNWFCRYCTRESNTHMMETMIKDVNQNAPKQSRSSCDPEATSPILSLEWTLVGNIHMMETMIQDVNRNAPKQSRSSCDRDATSPILSLEWTLVGHIHMMETMIKNANRNTQEQSPSNYAPDTTSPRLSLLNGPWLGKLKIPPKMKLPNTDEI